MIFLHKNAIGVSFPRRTSRITVTLCLTMGSAKGKGKADGMGGLCDRSMMSSRCPKQQMDSPSKLRGPTLGAQGTYFKDLP